MEKLKKIKSTDFILALLALIFLLTYWLPLCGKDLENDSEWTVLLLDFGAAIGIISFIFWEISRMYTDYNSK